MAGSKNRKGMGCFVKSFLAVLIAAAIYMGCYILFSPVWLEWNNYNTVYGFYKEPENTIETLFLGSSHVVNGITPTEADFSGFLQMFCARLPLPAFGRAQSRRVSVCWHGGFALLCVSEKIRGDRLLGEFRFYCSTMRIRAVPPSR